MTPYTLIGLASCFGVIWTVAFRVAVYRNDHPRITIHPDGRRSLQLVDFGPLLAAGVAVCALEVVGAIWFGLTVN